MNNNEDKYDLPWDDNMNAVSTELISPKKPNNSSAAAAKPPEPVEVEEVLAFARSA
jgi:hypothetical protein